MNYATLIESLECAVIVINRERELELVNISTETLFCQSRRNLLGRPLSEFISHEVMENCINECFENDSQFTLREVPVVVKGQESLVDMTLSSTTIAAAASGDVLPSILICLLYTSPSPRD